MRRREFIAGFSALALPWARAAAQTPGRVYRVACPLHVGRRRHPTQLRAFVQASAVVGDVCGPLVKLLQLAHSGSDPATQGLMAEEMANTFGKPALLAIRPLLSNEVLLTRPLLAAGFHCSKVTARWRAGL